jgi:hypothetical protein
MSVIAKNSNAVMSLICVERSFIGYLK